MEEKETSAGQAGTGASQQNTPVFQDTREGFARRRIPCLERRISDIRPDDVRVRVLGTVIDMDRERVVIDDGTGRITAVFDKPPGAKPNQLVRIFGRIIPVENGFELQADILQDMSRLDLELYKKVAEVVPQ